MSTAWVRRFIFTLATLARHRKRVVGMVIKYGIPQHFEDLFKVHFGEEDIRALKESLNGMMVPVEVKLFTDPNDRECLSCAEAMKLLEVISAASPTIGNEKAVKIDVYYVDRDREAFREYGVERVPTILLLNGSIVYLGMPAGEEIKGFVETLIRISTGEHGLSRHTVEGLLNLRGFATVEVIVTPLCPYCPYVALMANMFAYVSSAYGNKNVKSVIVEAYENPDIAEKYAVATVPVVAINGKAVFVGVPHERQLLDAVMRLAGAR